MRRELKFRTLTQYDSGDEMEYFTIYDQPLFTEDEKKSLEIMQYTGLKDMNGKEIYEGDIIPVLMYSGKYENYEIYWNDKLAEFDAKNKGNRNWITSSVWKDCEIIGNKHENPELVE